MKKFTALVVSLLMGCALFAQTDWGENLKWTEAFYAYVAGTNLSLNENKKMFLIKKIFTMIGNNFMKMNLNGKITKLMM